MKEEIVCVFLDSSAASDTRLTLAIEIARNRNASLIGAYVAMEAILGRHSDEFARGDAVGAVVRRETTDEDVDDARAARRFADLTEAGGIEAKWYSVAKHGTAADVLQQAQYADLDIVGQSSPDAPTMLWRPEDRLFAFGGPILIIPHRILSSASVGRNILIAWDASRQAKRALADAMPFLRKAERMAILVVDPEGITARGLESGAALALRLGRPGLQAAVVEIASDGQNIGQIIIDQARKVEADLIVMGAYGRLKVVEMVFGGATHTVLREMPVPVLMSR